jgi:hypothetical protein
MLAGQSLALEDLINLRRAVRLPIVFGGQVYIFTFGL